MQLKILRIYEAIVLRKPTLALTCIFLLTGFMALGLQHFKLDASAESLTLENDNDLTYYRDMVGRYGSDNYLIVTYQPKAGDLFDNKNIGHLKALRDDLSLISGVTGVVSILDLPLLYSPKIEYTDFSGKLRTLLSENINKTLAESEFQDSPIYKDTVISEDGQTTGMILNLKYDQTFLNLVRQRDTLRTRQIQGPLSTVEGTIFLGGPDMITADMMEFLKEDLLVFGIGVLIFMIVTLWLIFRQMRWVLLPLVSCTTCLVAMLGFFSWIDWRLTIISSNFISLLLIITLALSIHIIVRYQELSSQLVKTNQLKLVKATVASMIKPCFYTALTTAVAFMSLVVSNIRPVIDFGWMMTIGVGVSLATTFIVIPACMMLLHRSHPSPYEKTVSVTRVFAVSTEKNGRFIVLTSLFMGLMAAWGITQLEVENRFIDYFHNDTEIYKGMETIDTSLGGTTPLDIVLQAPMQIETRNLISLDETDDFDDDFEDDFDSLKSATVEQSAASGYWLSSAGLEDLSKLHAFLEAQQEVGKVNSLAQLYRVANDLSGKKLNDFELAVLKKNLHSEIYDQLVSPYYIEDSDETRVQLRVIETSEHLNREQLIRKIKQYLTEELQYNKEDIRLSGLLILYNNMLQSLYTSQVVTLGAVFTGILMMFTVLFRSIVISVIAIIPNLLAAIIVLGGMGITGIPLDMMTITIAAITVGIGVDHSIHYLTRFEKEHRLDRDYVQAMYRAHSSTGRALFYTATTIIAGFSILCLSNFIPSIYFGLLTSLSMIAALLGSMTLLPKLILLVRPFDTNTIIESLSKPT
jgi:predicted RND superfamily exporter protein